MEGKAIYLLTLALALNTSGIGTSTWMTDGLGKPLDHNGQPIPEHVIEMGKYIQGHTTLNQEQSQHAASIIHEGEKARFFDDYLAANDLYRSDDELISWLLVAHGGLSEDEAVHLMSAFRLNSSELNQPASL